MTNRPARAHILPWLVLLAAFALSVGIFAVWGGHNLDSDMSGEMMLAAQLNEERALISENWFYSTELRAVSPVMVYQLGLLLFDSWHAARVFSIAVLLALVAASALYLSHGAGLGTEAVYAAAAMMLPTSSASAFLFAHGGFYTMYFIAACLMLGVVVRLPGRRRAWPSLLALVLLGIWGGLSGVRMLMVCGVPLLAMCAAGIFFKALGAATMREAMACPEGRYLPGALAVNAGMIAGYAVNVAVLLPRCHFASHSGEVIEGFGLELILQQFTDLCGYLGWTAGVKVMGLGGICAFGVIAVAALMVFSPAYLARERACAQEGVRFIARFALTAVVIGVLLNAQMDRSGSQYTVVYYIAGLLLCIACAYILLSRLTAHIPPLRTLCMLAVTGVFALAAVKYTAHEVKKETQSYEAVADYLVQNDLTQGFATFWNAGVLTEASDGAIEVFAYDGWNEPERSRWLQSVSHADGLPDGRAFVYVERSEFDEYEKIPCAVAENLVWESEFGCVYVFDDPAVVDALQRAQ